MASAEIKKILELKVQLKESTEGHTLTKILKTLQELDINLEILAETGIGKVVNSFRKHDAVGDVAKTLVNKWKKLVPPSGVAQQQSQQLSPKEPSKTEIQQTDQEKKSKTSQNAVCPERKPKNENSGSEPKLSKNADGKSKAKPIMNKLKEVNKKNGANDSDVGLDSQISITDGKLFQLKEKSTNNLQVERKEESKPKVSDVTNNHQPKLTTEGKNNFLKESVPSKEKKRTKDKKRKAEKAAEREKDLESVYSHEAPSMSFEEYLSYDLEAPKRKKKPCEGKNPKRIKLGQKYDVKICPKSEKSITEVLPPVVSKRCVMDLLNVPLPTISPECEDMSQYQYFTEKKVEEKASEVCIETPVFTGQRLNKKMLVYSGSKVVYLPTMMSLYQQCIRTLQNNIDSLYEIGGVPFEILKPVLERCTPEQLLRIEEFNPMYIGVTDHLWERHCLRDFRNAQLQEYESWREMYLRLFEERERKFQQLTKSIVSAHSGRPKGRQVKMAFIHSAAKPPRNVRIQQELHGTAGPTVVPHAADKLGGRTTENRSRSGYTEPPKAFNAGSGASHPQDPRRIRRVAPMMAKSLKAFKKQIGRR
ncbi:Elongin-A [Bagarius yarrelli]|uniref:Elongin-A n=1 Tax=Bagarius yarrelli TaxID=175774 RepID=A0A556U729_BAGYA|nr:Elongin-A [Bagarius yarrelli]